MYNTLHPDYLDFCQHPSILQRNLMHLLTRYAQVMIDVSAQINAQSIHPTVRHSLQAIETSKLSRMMPRTKKLGSESKARKTIEIPELRNFKMFTFTKDVKFVSTQ